MEYFREEEEGRQRFRIQGKEDEAGVGTGGSFKK